MDDKTCCVCLEENTKVLQCKHNLCGECLKGIKKSGRTLCCPMCRWKPRNRRDFKLFNSLEHLKQRHNIQRAARANARQRAAPVIQRAAPVRQRAARKCGFCKQQGHTRARCPILLGIYEDTALWHQTPSLTQHAQEYLLSQIREVNRRFKMSNADINRLNRILTA